MTVRPRPAVRWLTALACGAGLGLPVAAGPISVTSIQALGFGKVASAQGGAVTVGASGARSATGGVVLLQSGPGAAAQFSITGDPSAHYAVTLPANGTVVLSSGARSMAVGGFTSNRPGGGNLGLGGTQVIAVGATLTIAAGQAPASYSGSFSISIDYD